MFKRILPKFFNFCIFLSTIAGSVSASTGAEIVAPTAIEQDQSELCSLPNYDGRNSLLTNGQIYISKDNSDRLSEGGCGHITMTNLLLGGICDTKLHVLNDMLNSVKASEDIQSLSLNLIPFDECESQLLSSSLSLDLRYNTTCNPTKFLMKNVKEMFFNIKKTYDGRLKEYKDQTKVLYLLFDCTTKWQTLTTPYNHIPDNPTHTEVMLIYKLLQEAENKDGQILKDIPADEDTFEKLDNKKRKELKDKIVEKLKDRLPKRIISIRPMCYVCEEFLKSIYKSCGCSCEFESYECFNYIRGWEGNKKVTLNSNASTELQLNPTLLDELDSSEGPGADKKGKGHVGDGDSYVGVQQQPPPPTPNVGGVWARRDSKGPGSPTKQSETDDYDSLFPKLASLSSADQERNTQGSGDRIQKP